MVKRLFCFLMTVLVIAVFMTSCDMTNYNALIYGSNSREYRNNASILTREVSAKVPVAFDRMEVRDVLVGADGVSEVRVCTTAYDKNNVLIAGNTVTINYDYMYYGMHRMEFSFYRNGNRVFRTTSDEIITSDAYNVAVLIATMPVTDYTLMGVNKDYRTDYFEASLPTIISLERAWSYTWKELPDNFLINPFLLDDVIHNGANASPKYWNSMYRNFEYVKYLYSLNPKSSFNFYINDYWPNQFLDYMAIGIPVDQMKFVFISDGSATFNVFCNPYGSMNAENDTSLAVYENLVSTWNTIKGKILADRLSGYDAMKATGRDQMRDFIQVMINDSELDVYWLVNNNIDRNFNSLKAYSEIVKVHPHFVKLDLNVLLTSLTDSEKNTLSKLYAFDNTALNEAVRQGKQPVIFLGTSTSGETHLDAYCKIMKNLLGNDYAYLYKGHPGHMTNGAENRQSILNAIGYIMLDASIPAELVAFFNPMSDLAGYSGSSFASYEKKIPFMCMDSYDSKFITNVENYAVLSGTGYLIVRNRLTNPEHTNWDGKSDWNSLKWTAGDPNK